MFPWFHDFLIEGVDHSNKALGEWGICIVWRNLNSIFCSVTFQSAYSVRPCVELSFLFCFYSHSSFKKWRTSLVVHFVNPIEACLWTLPVMNYLYRGLHCCRIVWSEEQAQFDLFLWIILDSVFPSGTPQGFSASVLYVERHVVKGALLVQGVSESPFQRFISSMKFTPNSYTLLWPFLLLRCHYAF